MGNIEGERPKSIKLRREDDFAADVREIMRELGWICCDVNRRKWKNKKQEANFLFRVVAP